MLVLYVLHLVDVDLDVYRWVHHTVPFIWLLGDIDQSIWMKSGILFTCIFIFCSLSQQMFCVCCTTLMSCFQIMTHWSHGQLKSLNLSKYDCMYLSENVSLELFSTQLLRMFLNVMLVVLKPCTLLFCCGGYFIFYILVLTLLSGIFSCFCFLDAWMHLSHSKV